MLIDDDCLSRSGIGRAPTSLAGLKVREPGHADDSKLCDPAFGNSRLGEPSQLERK